MIVWCLYDDGNMSYGKVLKDINEVQSISMGIQDKQGLGNNHSYIKIDLSLMNFDLIKQLNKLPKPDIILASPPCESWSISDRACRIYNTIEKDKISYKHRTWYDEWNAKAFANTKRKFIQKETGRILGEITAGAIAHIIFEIKPKVWVIENPRQSMLWDWLDTHWELKGIDNNVYYSDYDLDFTRKPTKFLSNINLDLKYENRKWVKNKKDFWVLPYEKRATIPTSLVKDIFRKCFIAAKYGV